MEIVTDENELRQPCAKVGVATGLKTGRKLLSFLLNWNRRNKINGIGLAAPQVGIKEKVCVILKPTQMVLVNPVIVGHSGYQFPFKEGCLSFGNKEVNTWRWRWVDVATDNLKNIIRFGALDFLDAVVAQHEIDHLNGILMFDRNKDLTQPYEGFRLGLTNQEGNSSESIRSRKCSCY